MRSLKQITTGPLLLLCFRRVAFDSFSRVRAAALLHRRCRRHRQKKLHFQLSNEYDILQRSAYPSLRQNTTVFELDYGLSSGVEIGVDGPLIAISNSHVTTPKTPFGIGDLDFHVKYNFLREREGSRLPALAATLNVELPTGDARKQLGSGFADYFLNGILQES